MITHSYSYEHTQNLSLSGEFLLRTYTRDLFVLQPKLDQWHPCQTELDDI
jgi:hypothetical protein